MKALLGKLEPRDLAFKGRIALAFYDNPFLEGDVEALWVRFGGERAVLASALEDLRRCGVLGIELGRYGFAPEDGDAVAAWCASLRGKDADLRQEVLERETLARLGETLSVEQREVSAILDMVPVGVLLLDRFGHLLKANATARKLLKVRAASFDVDVCVMLGLDPAQVLSTGCAVEISGPPPLSVTAQPFRVSGSDTGAVIIVQDISARRTLEAETERLREAFFSMIRHELHKPLMAVDRFLGQLVSEHAADESLGLARAAASHLGAMIDDMLLLARMERDPLSVVLNGEVSLQFLIAGADLAFRDRAQEAGVVLEVMSPEDDVVFWGDAQRLGQVLGNLLDNALKFTPEGGRVVLSGGREENRVWFSVQDSGPGIPEAERERIFDRFYQARTDAGRQPGLGLGLAICREVVAAHGGQIAVLDADGALIRVFLPIKREA